MQSEAAQREDARRALQDSMRERNAARIQETLQAAHKPQLHSGLGSRVAWYFRRKAFIISRLCVGDSLHVARHAWTLAMMEAATKRSLGVSMGDYSVVVNRDE